jgi:hypothetical protein
LTLDCFVVCFLSLIWHGLALQIARFHVAARGHSAAAVALTTYAVRNGSADNVTAMIVDLKGHVANLESRPVEHVPQFSSSFKLEKTDPDNGALISRASSM